MSTHPPAPRSRLRRYGWALVMIAPLLVAAAIVAAGWWAISTTAGLRAAASISSLLVPGLSIQGVDGTLRGGFSASSFVIRRERWSVRIDDVLVVPHDWSFASRTIDLESVAARTVAIDWVSGDPDAPPPIFIGAPVDVTLRRSQIAEVRLGARDAAAHVLRNVELTGRINAELLNIERVAFDYERTRVDAQGRIAAAHPFATTLRAQLAAQLKDRAVTARLEAQGSLERLQVALNGDDSAARAQVDATLRLFARIPLEALRARITSFDPALWFESVPSMQLAASADLAPVPHADGSWGVAGPFAIDNALAGPVDQDRVPVRSARGKLVWDNDTLTLDIDQAEAPRGSAQGRLTWSNASGVAADAKFVGIDVSTLHSRSVATDLAGALAYRFSNGEQRFSGNARNSRGLPLSAEFEARLREQILVVERALLRLGDGSAELRGRIEIAGSRAIQLSGRFGALDIAQLARGVDTRLNGSFELDGRLEPQLTGRARFELADSRIAGRPITGQGRVDLADRRFDADVDVRSGDAHLTAKGGLASGRELHIEADVPELAALLPQVGGRLQARLTLAGELDAIRADGSASANGLKLQGGHRIENITASFRGGAKPADPLALAIDVIGHTGPGGPERSIAAASLAGRGTMSDAHFDLAGTTGSQQPIRASTNGGWREGAWRGVLQSAEVGTPLSFSLRKPAPYSVALGSLSFGPAEFTLLGTHFSEFVIDRAAGRWHSAGRFDGLQPQALDARARAPRRVVRSGAGDRVPLTLGGSWDLSLVDSVSGIAVIERTGGDLYSGIDALNPIGISDVGAALSVLDNRVTGNVYVRGRALGSIDAAVDAYVDPSFSGGRVLAQERPFKVALDATLPDLSWIGPLIGDSVQFEGRGSINATVAGTPADPSSAGTMRGEALRLAWVDQAVRLENGRLDAVLDEGVLVINELSFAGTPRVAPLEKRALEGLIADKPFDVKAVGRIALRTLTGSIGLKATQLPILQRADRWMVVSGDAGITLTPERADLYAKLIVDGAYINFTALRGTRTLPGDVVVHRAGDEQKAAARAPVDVTLDVQGNLGNRFYIQGAGLEARLEGAVNVTGRPSQLRGEGSVRTVDGVYAGYGQRLQIQRGIVTFQGPIDNPGLNVLAVRAGLPVEVGVALSGSAQRPIVRLYSDPSMSDTEKLNWLVLGRPPGAGDGNDRAMLSAAASALFAGQTDSTTSNLMRSLGIDQITLQPGQSSGSLLPRETVAGRLRSGGVSSSNSAAADFLAVGKRINDDLYLSFEQALTGAEYFVALNYRLTRQLSLIARAGSTNALDLVYSLAFE